MADGLLGYFEVAQVEVNTPLKAVHKVSRHLLLKDCFAVNKFKETLRQLILASDKGELCHALALQYSIPPNIQPQDPFLREA